MSTTAITLDHLHKRFGRRGRQTYAVNDLSLEVASGQVYGFLGPNGAGKTTTIRLILDLLRPDKGQALLFGQSARSTSTALHRVGALVEGAAFYPYLTGRGNLEVLARTAGTLDRARIQMLLEQVDLADAADRRVNGYSLGMKQRLGVAAALLGDPDLVILDEPTNGLDPAGIIRMRTFIRELAHQHGKTVFLSSHLLNEVEQICDRVAIIRKGQLVREGTVSALLEEHSMTRIEAAPLERAVGLLQAQYAVSRNGSSLTAALRREDVPAAVQLLVAHDVAIYEVTTTRQSLEDYFLAVTDTAEFSAQTSA